MIHWDYFATQQKLSWDKFIRDFQYINAICKVKIFLSDEENYKKCCHETSKQTNKNQTSRIRLFTLELQLQQRSILSLWSSNDYCDSMLSLKDYKLKSNEYPTTKKYRRYSPQLPESPFHSIHIRWHMPKVHLTVHCLPWLSGPALIIWCYFDWFCVFSSWKYKSAVYLRRFYLQLSLRKQSSSW